jgi:CHAT domain-containing protein
LVTGALNTRPKVALRLLTTGRDLLRLQQPAKAGGAPVLIANPDFNAASRSATGGASAAASTAAGPSVLRGGQQRSSGLRGLTAWQPLGGTEQEARQLAPLLGGGAVISGPAATAAVVLAQRAPRILHIATHGFFLADQAAAGANATGGPAAMGARGLPAAGGGAGDGSAATTTTREDPLQRSGLVFAGANRPDANPSDDGYLTAAEATAMDLEGTELVTLSACETGLGGVRSGEGVYGLQRSLAVAGARSTLLSLWKVDDGMTATFMERYYIKLKAGQGRADALRDTQAEFRNNKNSTYNDIRVWGAFQLSGDWRALPKW